ncbi:unnamed protein product [Prunus armeniaca]|uniref:Uncharacterized protein n=1 Tax=Prunus armeniaca TaxID=36596 RepID=A0A6J5WIU2_PRUAR|nr:unnamed protein product [Prunus armeniaca]
MAQREQITGMFCHENVEGKLLVGDHANQVDMPFSMQPLTLTVSLIRVGMRKGFLVHGKSRLFPY